jgi:hypothetical protein
MSHPSHSSWFYHANNIGWVRIIQLRMTQLPPLPCYPALLGPNILLSTLFSNTLSLHSSLNVSDQVSHPYNTTGRIIVVFHSYIKEMQAETLTSAAWKMGMILLCNQHFSNDKNNIMIDQISYLYHTVQCHSNYKNVIYLSCLKLITEDR